MLLLKDLAELSMGLELGRKMLPNLGRDLAQPIVDLGSSRQEHGAVADAPKYDAGVLGWQSVRLCLRRVTAAASVPGSSLLSPGMSVSVVFPNMHAHESDGFRRFLMRSDGDRESDPHQVSRRDQVRSVEQPGSNVGASSGKSPPGVTSFGTPANQGETFSCVHFQDARRRIRTTTPTRLVAEAVAHAHRDTRDPMLLAQGAYLAVRASRREMERVWCDG